MAQLKCDQIARLFFKYLAIENSENLPNSEKKVQNFASNTKLTFGHTTQWAFA